MNDEFPEVRVEIEPKHKSLVVHIEGQKLHLLGAGTGSESQQIFAVALGLAHVRPCEYALRFLDSECSRRFAPLFHANDPSYKEVCNEWIIMRAEFAAWCRELELPSSDAPGIRALAETVGDFEAANAMLQEECRRFRLEQESTSTVH